MSEIQTNKLNLKHLPDLLRKAESALRCINEQLAGRFEIIRLLLDFDPVFERHAG